MELLLRNGHVFAPQYAGVADILIENGVITCIRPNIRVSAFVCARELDVSGLYIMPGFIDTHVHIVGGGGEKGEGSLLPPLKSEELVKNGITACVGMLGFERKKKTPAMLYDKVSEFNREGLETFALSGSYHLPLTTVYKTIAEDMEAIDTCMGAGEIALEDSRAPGIPLEELALLLQTVHKAVKKTGKPLKTVFHIGNHADGLSLLFRMAKVYEHTVSIAIPTHANRNEAVLHDAVEYVKMGGAADLTAGILPEEGEKTGMIPAPEALQYIMDKAGSLKNVTLSSDAGGSAPVYGEKGEITGYGVSRPGGLLRDLQAAYRMGLKLSDLLQTVTLNAAKAYGFSQGEIGEGAPAYMNVTDDDLNIKYTILKDTIY